MERVYVRVESVGGIFLSYERFMCWNRVSGGAEV